MNIVDIVKSIFGVPEERSQAISQTFGVPQGRRAALARDFGAPHVFQPQRIRRTHCAICGERANVRVHGGMVTGFEIPPERSAAISQEFGVPNERADAIEREFGPNE